MKRFPLALVAILTLPLLNAAAMPFQLGVTVEGKKAERSSSFVITNTGSLTTTYLISRKTATNVLGNPTRPTGFPPRLDVSYTLNGKPFTTFPRKIQLDPNQTATVAMKVRIIGAEPLAYTRKLETTVIASSESYLVPSARVPKTSPNVTPVKASDTVTIIIKRGSR